jgi:hypothetical protein
MEPKNNKLDKALNAIGTTLYLIALVGLMVLLIDTVFDIIAK